jgi:hypothetical protein
MILSIFDRILKFSWKKLKMHVLRIDTDPDRPVPDRQTVDVDPDPYPDPVPQHAVYHKKLYM